jgi:hypothetical protein
MRDLSQQPPTWCLKARIDTEERRRPAPEPRQPQHDAVPWHIMLYAVTDTAGTCISLNRPVYRDTEGQARDHAETLLNLCRGQFDQCDLCFLATISQPYLKSYTAYLVASSASVDWDTVPGRG